MVKKIISILAKIIGDGYHFIKYVLTLALGATVFAVVVFLVGYLYFAKDLPNIETLDDYQPQVISEAFSDDGTPIGEFWLECRINLPIDQIPKRVIQAFVDSEDSRFFEHKGVDVRSIFRAFIANLKAGEIQQGGSTITQQITRSLLLTREKKISRKIKEAILATRIERHLNKEQILTLYLNQIYLGNRAYGAAAAARNYFRKDLDDLSLGQTALIAGLPSAPTAYSPINNAAEARNRQLHVLQRMVDEDHITEKEAEEARNEKFDIFVAGTDKVFNDKYAAYFTEHVRRLVKERYGDEGLYYKGLKIYTTVNLPMQKMAVKALRHGIESMDRRMGYKGAIGHVQEGDIDKRSAEIANEIATADRGIVIEWPGGANVSTIRAPELIEDENYKAVVTGFSGNDALVRIGSVTGTIRYDNLKWAKPFTTGWLGYEGGAYVKDPKQFLKVGDIVLVRKLADGTFGLAQDPEIQGALFSMDPHSGFAKALVGGYDFRKSEFDRTTQAMRQPGSSWKPFIYASALDKGYTFDTVIMDSPVTYTIGKGNVWSPKNYGNKCSGPTSFKSALQFSRNIPTVKITYDIGTHYLTGFVRKLGITTPIEKYLSMALGSNAVYLKDMVEAYSTFANNGIMHRAVFITKIEDAKGNVLESITPEPKIDIKPQDIAAVEEEKSEEEKPEVAEEQDPAIDPDSATYKSVEKLKEGDLNPALFREGTVAIQKDGLVFTDLELKTLYGSNIPEGHVLTPQTSYMMVQMLKAVVEGGTGTRVKAIGKPAAGKTGTTNDETDTWFIGFVPDLMAGVWVGFDEVKQIAKGATGGNTAAPIFVEYMKAATEGWEAKDFAKPEDFPQGEIAKLAGGSAIFGSKPTQIFAGTATSDRAGRFFEEDLEDVDSGSYGYAPPAPTRPDLPPQGGAEPNPESGF